MAFSPIGAGADCACLLDVIKSAKDHRRDHDLVVRALVAEIDTAPVRAPGAEGEAEVERRFATLHVRAVWKGPHESTLVVHNDIVPRACQVPCLAVGTEYLIFATRSTDGWTVGECNPSRATDEATTSIKALGKPSWRAPLTSS